MNTYSKQHSNSVQDASVADTSSHNPHAKRVLDVLKNNVRNYSMFIILGVIFLVFGFFTGFINMTPRNLSNIFIQNSYILILATGMVLVIITGNIDLSVGSIAAFVGAISAMVYNLGVGIWVTLVVSILVGFVIGSVQGSLIAFLKIPSFIVTLAGMLLYRGLTYLITNVTPISLRDVGFKRLASGFFNTTEKVGAFDYLPVLLGVSFGIFYIVFELYSRRTKIKHLFEVLPVFLQVIKMLIILLAIIGVSIIFAFYRGIPVVFVLLAAVVTLFVFITNRTVFGREVYAVGGNARAAKLSGINSERVVFFVFVIMGGLAGLSGMVFAGYLNSALPQAGTLFELEAIAASFIGGASASGGIGTVIGAITGGLVMGGINNGMSLMNLASHWQFVVKALVLIFAVWYDLRTRNKAL